MLDPRIVVPYQGSVIVDGKTPGAAADQKFKSLRRGVSELLEEAVGRVYLDRGQSIGRADLVQA